MTRGVTTYHMHGVILLLCLGVVIACSSGEGIDDEALNLLGDVELTDQEVTALSDELVTAMNAVNGEFNTAGATARTAVPRVTVALVGEHPCLLAGRISYTGNVTVSVDTTAGTSSTFGQIQFNVSDPTNNRNDCEVAEDVILDGTLTFTIAGNSDDGIGLSLIGTIDVNERGSGGGLVLNGSCFIRLTVPRGGTVVSGSICGRAI